MASAALRGVAGRRHRVDLDELLVDVEGALLVGVQAFGRERRPGIAEAVDVIATAHSETRRR